GGRDESKGEHYLGIIATNPNMRAALKARLQSCSGHNRLIGVVTALQQVAQVLIMSKVDCDCHQLSPIENSLIMPRTVAGSGSSCCMQTCPRTSQIESI